MRRRSPSHGPRFACVEVRRIGGSASQPRVDTPTAAFLPPRGRGKDSVLSLGPHSHAADVPLPSIEVYALCDAYYVVDDHRAAGDAA
jgi:hypothetical protein